MRPEFAAAHVVGFSWVEIDCCTGPNWLLKKPANLGQIVSLGVRCRRHLPGSGR
jgi:hypothetical protein